MDVAISVSDGHFTWDAPPPQMEKGKKKGEKKKHAPVKEISETKEKEKIFTLHDVNMKVAMGQLTAIVGAFELLTRM